MIEGFLERVLNGFLTFASPYSRLFVVYLLSALVLATLVFLWFRWMGRDGARPEGVRKGYLGFVFDRSVFLHPSARQDYLYFLVNTILYTGIVSQALVWTHASTDGLLALFDRLFGPLETALFEPSLTAALVWTLISVLVVDFCAFFAHWLQHRYPVLWQFHQVHHSAEVLTPITFARMHPVDLMLTSLIASSLGGLAMASYIWLAKTEPQIVKIAGVNVILFGFYLLGYNLRHSHIWLSYPRWLSYIFISPAQHQTHHSVDAKHFDRNFGLIFSIWDWMFGTLYVPKGYEKLTFGLSRKEPNPFPDVVSLYVDPFRNAWEIIRKKQRGLRLGAGAALVALGGLIAAQALGPVRADAGWTPPSVHLEELTWTEVAAARNAGYDAILIPTGGTEQGGPHVVLGKHNVIVRHTAGEIARRAGKMLVAPVIAYVPQGARGPEKSGHMHFPGTISIDPVTLEAVLTQTVESAFAHGFARVYLLGDSSGNQAPQARVARRFAAAGRQVVHLDAYYAGNGQTETLRAEGFTEAQIGKHAGIRDTSELLALDPSRVRAAPILPDPGTPTGASGDASLASARIGRVMLELKIDAALRQIAEARGQAAGG